MTLTSEEHAAFEAEAQKMREEITAIISNPQIPDSTLNAILLYARSHVPDDEGNCPKVTEDGIADAIGILEAALNERMEHESSVRFDCEAALANLEYHLSFQL